MSKRPEDAAPKRIVSGGKAIAQVIDRSEKATFCALERGQIPGAVKIGGRWVLDTHVYYATFAPASAAA